LKIETICISEILAVFSQKHTTRSIPELQIQYGGKNDETVEEKREMRGK
jgi:hypothetical protein